MTGVGALAGWCGDDPLHGVEFGWTRLAWSCGWTRAYLPPARDGVWVDRDGGVVLVRWRGVVTACVSGSGWETPDRFAIRAEDALLIVELDRVRARELDPAGWSAAVVEVAP